MADAATPELTLETVKTPGEITFRCKGRLTSATSSLLLTTVRGLMPETKMVVLDLTELTYMDSSGLGAVVGLYVSARRQKCGLKLINLSARLQELFRITKLSAIFQGHEDFLGYTPD